VLQCQSPQHPHPAFESFWAGAPKAHTKAPPGREAVATQEAQEAHRHARHSAPSHHQTPIMGNGFAYSL